MHGGGTHSLSPSRVNDETDCTVEMFRQVHKRNQPAYSEFAVVLFSSVCLFY